MGAKAKWLSPGQELMTKNDWIRYSSNIKNIFCTNMNQKPCEIIRNYKRLSNLFNNDAQTFRNTIPFTRRSTQKCDCLQRFSCHPQISCNLLDHQRPLTNVMRNGSSENNRVDCCCNDLYLWRYLQLYRHS